MTRQLDTSSVSCYGQSSSTARWSGVGGEFISVHASENSLAFQDVEALGKRLTAGVDMMDTTPVNRAEVTPWTHLHRGVGGFEIKVL